MTIAMNTRSPANHMNPPASCWSSSGVGPQVRTFVA